VALTPPPQPPRMRVCFPATPRESQRPPRPPRTRGTPASTAPPWRSGTSWRGGVCKFANPSHKKNSQTPTVSVQHSSLLIGSWRVFYECLQSVLERVFGERVGWEGTRKDSFNSQSKGWNVLVSFFFLLAIFLAVCFESKGSPTTRWPPSAAAAAYALLLGTCSPSRWT
jgi:hypothetical protein